MIRSRLFAALTALACCLSLAVSAAAAEVDCDDVYCFSAEDFGEELSGVCITDLPEQEVGTVSLGQRILRPGDILTAQQLAQLTFAPARTEADAAVSVSYLPILGNSVGPETTVTISIRGKEDKAPVAEDSAGETYKNLPLEGKLKVKEPENQTMTFAVTRQPKRGTVEISEDGSFTYTPKKNKVGVDSFVYTATDPAGNVSREATVTVQILKPSSAATYTDTVGLDCRFEAEWLRNTGLFTGESISGQTCFYPDKQVSRGEFLAMVVKALEIPTEIESYSGIPADVPQWLKPYVGAAMRSGLLEGLPEKESGNFEPEASITGAEVAVMLQNALDLRQTHTEEVQQEVPVWAADALAVMGQYDVALSANAPLNRAQAAQVLYQVSQLALTAPGMEVFRIQ